MATKKTRFCPSPTGLMHLGNLRTALLNFLLSKKSKGSFILRIEDTDKERSKKEFAELICDDLTWMDLNWDEGPRTSGPQDPYFQSERNQLYEKFYAELIDKDLIYPCFATEEELKVIRRNQLAAGNLPGTQEFGLMLRKMMFKKNLKKALSQFIDLEFQRKRQ